jgi:hypothetical protein
MLREFYSQQAGSLEKPREPQLCRATSVYRER